MRIMIYLTSAGTEKGTTPVLYLEDRPGMALPEHPRAQTWTYFATVDASDQLLGRELGHLRKALEKGVPYVSELMPLGL